MNAPPQDPPSVESLVTLAVDDFLDRLRHGEEPDVDEYAARYPQMATLLRSLLPTLRLMQTPESGTAGAAVPAPLAERLGDYRLVRMLGRGGMGIVYEAEQQSLQRRVALKVLPFAAALDPLQLQRFKNEAQAAAHLQHPSIVPVYTVGCEQGIHFFAMQYIEGQSLAALLRKRRDDSDEEKTETPPTPSPTPTSSLASLEIADSIHTREYQQAVARVGVQAADALEHAHRQGVIHRDIKPANLLLDGHGVLWLTDFGLARYPCDVGLTQSGDVIGTLPYMSPEQASAQHNLLDQRTDVYALGATLYELLTLEPPFAGGDRQQLLRQIAEQEPRPPRSLNPAIPADLNTILLKTLEKNPADRYGTARELGEDLQRFLDDQPIRALRPSWGHRLRNWSRRHRTLVGAAAACLMLAVGLLTLSTLWIWEHHLRTQDAYEAKLREQVQIRENLDRSLQLLEEVFLQSAENRLLREADRERADQQILEKGLRFYQEFVARNATNSTVRYQTAKAHFRVAYIYKHLGRLADAEKAYDEAILLWERLATDYPRFLQLRQDLANALHMRASVRCLRGQPDAAAADMEREEQLLRHFVEKFPEILVYHGALAACRNNRSLFLYNRGQLAQADALIRSYLPPLQQLSAEHPYDQTLQSEVASAHAMQGRVLASLGQAAQAENAYRTALRLVPEQTDSRPKATAYALKRASLHHQFAVLLRLQGRLQEARQAHETARAAFQQLVVDFPNMPDLHKELAEVNDQYGLLLVALGERSVAEDAFRQATDVLERLTKAFPERHEYRMSLASSWNNLGILFERSQRPREAEKAYENAADGYAALVANHPQAPIYQHHAGGVFNNLARIVQRHGDFDKAQALFETALHHQRVARSMNRDDTGYRDALCRLYENWLNFLLAREDHEAAARGAEQLLRELPYHWTAAFRAATVAQRCQELVLRDPVLPLHMRVDANRVYARRAERWWQQAVALAADHAEARDELAKHLAHEAVAGFRDARAAVDFAVGAVKMEPRRAKYWLTLGSAHCRLREWSSAIDALSVAWRLGREESGDTCFLLAMAHWHENSPAQAQFWYRRGLSWMKRHERAGNGNREFQVEAAALLGQIAYRVAPG